MPKRIIVLISQAFTSMTADSYKIACVDICRSVVSILLINTPTVHNTSQSPVFLIYIANSRESSFSRLIVHIQITGKHSMHCYLPPQVLSKKRSEILDMSKVFDIWQTRNTLQSPLRLPTSTQAVILATKPKLPYHPPIHTTPVTSHMPS